MQEFLIMYFSVGIILYLLTCIKYKKIQKTDIKHFLKNILLGPFLIIYVIWNEL